MVALLMGMNCYAGKNIAVVHHVTQHRRVHIAAIDKIGSANSARIEGTDTAGGDDFVVLVISGHNADGGAGAQGQTKMIGQIPIRRFRLESQGVEPSRPGIASRLRCRWRTKVALELKLVAMVGSPMGPYLEAALIRRSRHDDAAGVECVSQLIDGRRQGAVIGDIDGQQAKAQFPTDARMFPVPEIITVCHVEAG